MSGAVPILRNTSLTGAVTARTQSSAACAAHPGNDMKTIARQRLLHSLALAAATLAMACADEAPLGPDLGAQPVQLAAAPAGTHIGNRGVDLGTCAPKLQVE